MKLKNSHIGVLIVLILIGGIYVAKGFDLWATESEKIPVKLSEGVGAGTYDPFDIRGSYTFEEIARLFEIDITLLAEAFQLGDADAANARQSKELEALYGELPGGVEIGNESVQVFVAIMKELDIDGADAYLPTSAVQVLLRVNSKRSDEILAYLESHQVDVTVNSDTAAIASEGNLETASDESTTEENAASTSEGNIASSSKGSVENTSEGENELRVNGNTTFSQVLDFGISKEQIETILDAKMPPENQSVKSYCTDNGLSFSVVKEALNALITP